MVDHDVGLAAGGGRVRAAFAAGRAAGRPLLVPFLTAGYPARGATVEVVRAVARAGADIVELGIPFSDPLADGPTIQRCSEAALAAGMSVGGVLEIVEELRSSGGDDGLLARTPLILMGYCNPLLAYGMDRFVDDAAGVGVDGLIVPDLPPEEGEEYRAACVRAGLSATYLMAPNAPDERIRRVDAASTHFSYCVSVTGVTGARDRLADRTVDFLRRVAGIARKPYVVGFGIKAPEHVLSVGPHAAGVVVGSALLERVGDADDPARAAAELIGSLRGAAEEVAGRRDAGGDGS